MNVLSIKRHRPEEIFAGVYRLGGHGAQRLLHAVRVFVGFGRHRVSESRTVDPEGGGIAVRGQRASGFDLAINPYQAASMSERRSP